MRASSILTAKLSKSLQSIHRSRLKSVFFGVDALLRGGRLSLTSLGRAAAGPVVAKHNIKRIDRLLGNRHLLSDIPTVCTGITALLIKPKSRPIVLVDWTRIGDTHCALVASLARDGRALPLYFEVHSKYRLANPGVEQRFLERLKEVIPSDCRPILVTDGGYRNPWFHAVKAMGWLYVGRLSTHVYVQTNGSQKWMRNDALEDSAQHKPIDCGLCLTAKTNPMAHRILIASRFKRNAGRRPQKRRRGDRGRGHQRTVDRNRVPWILATNISELSPKKIMAIYATRMQIEETFRDTKSVRFGWSFRHARTRHSQRYAVMLLLAALAGMVVTLLGIAAERKRLHLRFQANTIRHRRVLSLFQLGKLINAAADPPKISQLDLNDALKTLKHHEIIQ